MTEEIATSSPDPASPSRRPRKAARAVFPPVLTIDTLLGAHPDALRDIYEAGEPADPSHFNTEPEGRLLALAPFTNSFHFTRSLVRSVSRTLLPWRGKSFESGGTSGSNRLFSFNLFRFCCHGATSLIDGQKTLRLSYDGFDHPWPISHVVDELRTVGDKVAIGPAFLMTARGPKLLLWWGLQLA